MSAGRVNKGFLRAVFRMSMSTGLGNSRITSRDTRMDLREKSPDTEKTSTSWSGERISREPGPAS